MYALIMNLSSTICINKNIYKIKCDENKLCASYFNTSSFLNVFIIIVIML